MGMNCAAAIQQDPTLCLTVVVRTCTYSQELSQ